MHTFEDIFTHINTLSPSSLSLCLSLCLFLSLSLSLSHTHTHTHTHIHIHTHTQTHTHTHKHISLKWQWLNLNSKKEHTHTHIHTHTHTHTHTRTHTYKNTHIIAHNKDARKLSPGHVDDLILCRNDGLHSGRLSWQLPDVQLLDIAEALAQMRLENIRVISVSIQIKQKLWEMCLVLMYLIGACARSCILIHPIQYMLHILIYNKYGVHRYLFIRSSSLDFCNIQKKMYEFSFFYI